MMRDLSGKENKDLISGHLTISAGYIGIKAKAINNTYNNFV